MNKKGESAAEPTRKPVYWMPAGVIILMLVFGLFLMIGKYQNKLTEVPVKLKTELIALRFVNNPECFAYQEPETKRVYPGVIDFKKFKEAKEDQKKMDNCYKSQDNLDIKNFNFGLELKGRDVFLRTDNYHYVDTFVLEEVVLVKEGENLAAEKLLIHVQEKI